MPVLSPRRSSASAALSSSFRPTFGSSLIDRPYYGSGGYTPHTTYSERYSTRSYYDSDGRRVVSRQSSITEDGVTTRFREESREPSSRRDSLSRDSGIASIREHSILDTGRRDRDGSASRLDSSGRRDSESRLSAINVAESIVDLRNKYSPSSYVPACMRNRNNDNNIARSKSINDIGKPPAPSDKLKVKTPTTYSSNGLVANAPNNTNTDAAATATAALSIEDDNGNRPSVAEMRRKFDPKSRLTNGTAAATDGGEPQLEVRGVRIAENRFIKQDSLEGGNINRSKGAKDAVNGLKAADGIGKEEQQRPAKHFKLEGEQCSEKQSPLLRGGLAADAFVSSPSSFDSGVKKSDGLSSSLVVDGGPCCDNGFVESANGVGPSDGSGLGGQPPESAGEMLGTGAPDGSDLDNYGYLEKRVYAAQAKDVSASPRSIGRTAAVPSSNSIVVAATNNHVSSNHVGGGYQRGTNSLERQGRRSPTAGLRGPSPPVKSLGLNGLKNIGNTCFMNSVIQCLSNTRPLLEYVSRDGYLSDINTSISSMKGALIKAFADVIKELWSEDASDRVVNTVGLKSQIQRFAPRFIGYSQQDAQEFLRYLLEGLHEDVNRVVSKPAPIHTEIDEKLADGDKASESWQRYLRMDNSKIVDIFVGQLKSTLRCTHCGHCSVTFDPFWDLSLPIPQRAGQLRMQQCLEYFTREETLDGDEKPTCSKCKERRKCTKSFSIQKFPKILVIHLKRFSPTERFRGKLSVTIDFPLEGLDMKNYAADGVSSTDCRYNLYAVSNHSGTTYSGHYTAYCRHPYSHTWHEYNDSRVSTISPRSVVSSEAYVLFYELENPKSHL